MKHKGMVTVTIVATLLLPLASPGTAGIPSSHDAVEVGKSALEPEPALQDQQVAAADLSGLPLVPRALILLTLLIVTGAATTDVVNGEVKRRRLHRGHAVRH